MILEKDNKGAMDLTKNFSVSGRTRHNCIRQSFLRELKEEGIIRFKWIPTEENSAGIFTKNLNGPVFDKHASSCIGTGEYMKQSK
jgi:hypothetical protein